MKTIIFVFIALSIQLKALAGSEQYYGHIYIFEKSETHENSLGGKVHLLTPHGYDPLGTKWIPLAILIEGQMTSETPGVVNRLIKQNNKINTVYFNSPGGELSAGILIGKLLFDNKIDTVVNSANCYSACALAFIAGSKRLIISDKSNFGFHRQYYLVDGKVTYGSWRKDATLIDEYLRSINFSGIEATEIVGTKGLSSYSQEALVSKSIVTSSANDFFNEIYSGIASPSGYELFYSACYAAFIDGSDEYCRSLMADKILNSLEPVRLPALNIYLLARTKELGNSRSENFVSKTVLPLLKSQFRDINNKSEILKEDCEFFNSDGGDKWVSYVGARANEVFFNLKKFSNDAKLDFDPYADLILRIQNNCQQIKNTGRTKTSEIGIITLSIPDELKSSNGFVDTCRTLTSFMERVAVGKNSTNGKLMVLKNSDDYFSKNKSEYETQVFMRKLIRWIFDFRDSPADYFSKKISEDCARTKGYSVRIQYANLDVPSLAN